jgi:hypothetical protein
MSCNLTKYCFINDLKSLKQILIPENQSENELMRGLTHFAIVFNLI